MEELFKLIVVPIVSAIVGVLGTILAFILNRGKVTAETKLVNIKGDAVLSDALNKIIETLMKEINRVEEKNKSLEAKIYTLENDHEKCQADHDESRRIIIDLQNEIATLKDAYNKMANSASPVA